MKGAMSVTCIRNKTNDTSHKTDDIKSEQEATAKNPKKIQFASEEPGNENNLHQHESQPTTDTEQLAPNAPSASIDASNETSNSIHFPAPPQPPDLDPNDPHFLQNLHSKYFPNLPTIPVTSHGWRPLTRQTNRQPTTHPKRRLTCPTCASTSKERCSHPASHEKSPQIKVYITMLTRPKRQVTRSQN